MVYLSRRRPVSGKVVRGENKKGVAASQPKLFVAVRSCSVGQTELFRHNI